MQATLVLVLMALTAPSSMAIRCHTREATVRADDLATDEGQSCEAEFCLSARIFLGKPILPNVDSAYFSDCDRDGSCAEAGCRLSHPGLQLCCCQSHHGCNARHPVGQ